MARENKLLEEARTSFCSAINVRQDPLNIDILSNPEVRSYYIEESIKNCRFDLIESLDYHNVNLNISMPNSIPSIHYAVEQYLLHRDDSIFEKQNLYKIIELLLLKIPNANDLRYNDMRAVDIAAQCGDLAIVKLFLYYDFCPDPEGPLNIDHISTTLMFAANSGHLDIMFQLYLHGAELPKGFMRQNLHPLAVRFIEKLEEVKLLNVIDYFINIESEGCENSFDKILNDIETKLSQISDVASLDQVFADMPNYIYDEELHVISDGFDTLPTVEYNHVGANGQSRF